MLSLEKEIRHFIKHYCNDLDIKLAFSSFKIGNLFGVKDPVPDGLRSRVVYEFVCASCNACYVGENSRYFFTHVREHLVSDRASHIFSHLKDSPHCRALCSTDNFHVLDHASTSFQLKIKEAIHIQREQPSLHQQLNRVNLNYLFNSHTFMLFLFPCCDSDRASDIFWHLKDSPHCRALCSTAM